MSEDAMTVYEGEIQQENSLAVMPVVNLAQAIQRYQAMKDFIDKVLHEKVDYGVIPGTEKNTLLKPGAEKLCWLFGLRPVFHDVSVVEDWSGKDHDGEPFFYYRRSCALMRGNSIVVQAEGSCNSREKKYRYRWVNETDVPAHLDKSKLPSRGGRVSEFEFALTEAKTSGQYSKPPEYWAHFKTCIENGTATQIVRKAKSGKEFPAWEIDTTMYAIPNNEISDLTNTLLKMADKRALIAATLIGANASEWFTQDVEDFVDGTFIPADAAPGEVHQPAPAPAAPVKPAPVQPQVKAPVKTAGSVAGGMMATIGKNKYPMAWGPVLMPAIIATGKCNMYELDGILQKLLTAGEITAETDPEVVSGGVESYLNAKVANEDPLLAAHDFFVACVETEEKA